MSENLLPTSAFGAPLSVMPQQSNLILNNENALLSSKLNNGSSSNGTGGLSASVIKPQQQQHQPLPQNRRVLSDLKQQQLQQQKPTPSRKRPRSQPGPKSSNKKKTSFAIYSDPTATSSAPSSASMISFHSRNGSEFDYEEEPDRFHKSAEPIPDPPVTCSYWDEEQQRYVTDVHYQIQPSSIIPSVVQDLCPQPKRRKSFNKSEPIQLMMAEPMPLLLDDHSPIDGSSVCLEDIQEFANVAAGMDCIISEFDWDNL